MTHRGWYWRVKRRYKPKRSCERFKLTEIDSFSLFKYKDAVQLVRESSNKIAFEIPLYSLRATLREDDSFHVAFINGEYIIPVEKKPCNFGGFYHFFRCPKCDKRMRKLYCIDGQYQCRKCGNLAYYSQRLRPAERAIYMKIKIKECLENQAGSLNQKPPWMKHHTFQKLRQKYVKHDEQYFNRNIAEFKSWFPHKDDRFFRDPYILLMPSDMYDAYVEW
jgi:hypothetical protein